MCLLTVMHEVSSILSFLVAQLRPVLDFVELVNETVASTALDMNMCWFTANCPQLDNPLRRP